MQQDSDSSKQLGERKRLDHVVISTQIQPFNSVFYAIAS